MTDLNASETNSENGGSSRESGSSAYPGRSLTKRERHLALFLQFVGCWTLLAFVVAVMPASWMVEIAGHLSIDDFPESPLTFYLARNLSLIYGFGGIGLFVIAADLPRYRPMIFWLATGTIAFGVGQMIVDWMSGLPSWWTFGESLSTMGGGTLIAWLDRRAKRGSADS